MVNRIAPVLVLAALVVLGVGPSAMACPSGTVFSAYKGKGLCLRAGQGLSVAAKCAQVYVGAECPSDMRYQAKASDPGNGYCCPKTYKKYRPSCNAQCEPLLTSVTPLAEAQRVHFNCMSLCAGGETAKVICPDGKRRRAKNC